MTNQQLFEKLFGVKTHITNSCQCISCEGHIHCDSCRNKNFWGDEVDLARVGANLACDKDLGKAMLNSMFGRCSINYGTRTGKNRVEEGVLLTQGWKKLPPIFNRTPLKVLYEILDDATANGFEVKIHNGVILYRESDYQNTDSVQDIV